MTARGDVWVVSFGRWEELRKRLAEAKLGTRKLVKTNLGEQEILHLFRQGPSLRHVPESVRGMVDFVRAGYYVAEASGGKLAVVGTRSALTEALNDAVASSVLGT